MRNLSFVIAFALAQISLASAQDKSIVVASTTSTQDSGLFGHILPLFKAKTGIDVKVVALGSGQALDMAPWRCRCGFGACQGGREEIHCGRAWREALSRDVQRFYHHRTEGRSRQHQWVKARRLCAAIH
jgi:hypothetical protein